MSFRLPHGPPPPHRRRSRGIRIGSVSAQDAAPAAGMPEHVAGWPKFNLNVAASEQLLAIPGSGEKMLDEFRKYAPFSTIARFRGEIGKDIDPDAVAALEAYLYVPVAVNDADADTLRQLPGVTGEAAAKLADGRPYADNAAFLKALEGVASPDLAAAAAAFLGA